MKFFYECIRNDEHASKKEKKGGGDANLVWTDDEIQLLLEVIRDFKAIRSH